MHLIQESFQRLFPDKEFPYQTEMEYNRRLGNFNANICLRQNKISLNLNLQWKNIDDEIKIGLIQHLLLKVLKKKINSPNLELYHNFIKNAHLMVPKNKTDPLLESSFHRTNEQFFNRYLEQPNLAWGRESFRKLASYNYHNDTVTVSSIFTAASKEIIDYLMYHELLHKDLKFRSKNGRSHFHTKEFKQAEALYPHQKEIEKEISQIIKSKKRKSKGLWKFF